MTAHVSHLGDIAAAVADGELGHDDRDRALAHITWCPECRADVDGQRRGKARVIGAGVPDLPPGLLDRLIAIPSLSADEAFALMHSELPTPSPGAGNPRSRHRVSMRRRRLSAALVGSASVLALGVWAAPNDTSRVPYELVNAGGHPASYGTVEFTRMTGASQLRQLPGFGFLGRP
jgi:anti-sigma factor RsiW